MSGILKEFGMPLFALKDKDCSRNMFDLRFENSERHVSRRRSAAPREESVERQVLLYFVESIMIFC